MDMEEVHIHIQDQGLQLHSLNLDHNLHIHRHLDSHQQHLHRTRAHTHIRDPLQIDLHNVQFQLVPEQSRFLKIRID